MSAREPRRLVRQELAGDVDRHIGGNCGAARSRMRAFAVEPLPNSTSAASAGISFGDLGALRLRRMPISVRVG